MNISKKSSVFIVKAALLLSGITPTAQASSLITTDFLADREGNSQVGFFVPSPSRFQQVFDASQFGLKPIRIDQIVLRPDASVTNPLNFNIVNLEVFLSTTVKDVDGLSDKFEENIGLDSTQVFGGQWNINSQNVGRVDGPKEFDIIINQTNPYFYDPRKGNLLMEYKKFSSEATGFIFDSESVLGDSTSTKIAAGDANATDADPNFSSTLGIVTQFKVASVPEPSLTIGMLIIGILGSLKKMFQ